MGRGKERKGMFKERKGREGLSKGKEGLRKGKGEGLCQALDFSIITWEK